MNINSPLSEKVKFILERYAAGAYGTFENPKRSAGVYSIFWSVALGHREAKEYRGSWDYCFAKAGKIVKERRKK